MIVLIASMRVVEGMVGIGGEMSGSEDRSVATERPWRPWTLYFFT